MTDVETKNLALLTRTLAALDSPKEAEAYLRELCTPQEIRAIAQRAGIAELLIQKIPYMKIAELLGDKNAKRPSTATVNRVNDVVQNGDGYLHKMILRATGAEGC